MAAFRAISTSFCLFSGKVEAARHAFREAMACSNLSPMASEGGLFRTCVEINQCDVVLMAWRP